MHSEELNVIKFKREMEQMINKNAMNLKRLNEILTSLNSLDVGLQCLQKTKIGVCVNNVRKTFKNNSQIVTSTACLIKKWKKIAKEEFCHPGDAKSHEALEKSVAVSSSTTPPPNGDAASTASTARNEGSSTSASLIVSDGEGVVQSFRRRSDSDNAKDGDIADDLDFDRPNFLNVRNERIFSAASSTGGESSKKKRKMSHESVVPQNFDNLRRKSVELLADALKFEPNDRHAEKLAVEIESFIWEGCSSGSNDPSHKAYKAKMRSRLMNLRDKNNPELLKNVILGSLTPQTFANMSVEEMASDRLKKWRESVEQETIKERQSLGPTQSLAKSQMFACPKCAERDACYTISQDRVEGDYEPVCVTSLFCNKCGHSWKNY